ncbi:MAG: DUF4097 domain-containing protein [Gammaproteobacteria bacterium]|nr:DUF4097 domain-containing protein [Gammaproteobacteria bacterium]
MQRIKVNLLLAAALLFTAGAVQGATHTVQASESFPGKKGTTIEVENLAGEISIEGVRGGDIQLDAEFVGGGDDDDEAREMAAMLSFDVSRSDDVIRVHVNYPVDDFRRFTYRPDGIWGDSNSQVRYQGDRVTVGSRSGGAELHADIRLRVPAGVNVKFENRVGSIQAEGVRGDMFLDTSSGSVTAKDGQGRLSADTGSGSVGVSNYKGNVSADTGSGSVTVEDIEGDVEADTGSGAVDIFRAKSASIEVDTGSGSVELEDVSGDLMVDTGSGGVRAHNITAGSRLMIDTGSGGVRLDGDLSGVERLNIDTGSGSVTMRTTKNLNMNLQVSAGSGGVSVDLPDINIIHMSRGEFEADIGNGSGRGVIDTGSGGVRISIRD